MSELNEDELHKALSELEDTIAKSGDALSSQPHDGGFATEGTNIQTRAKALKKALEAIGQDITLEKAEKLAKMLSASDMDDDDESDEDAAKKSIDGEFGDDEGAAALAGAVGDDAFAKALAADDPAVQEMIDASDFIDKLVNQTGTMINGIQGEVSMLAKSLGTGQSTQREFNTKTARALVAISKSIESLTEQITVVSETPVLNSRQTTLRKSDVATSPIRFGGIPIPGQNGHDARVGEDYMSGSPLLEVPMSQIQEALIQKALAKKVPTIIVTEFENQKDFSVLPKAIFKALEQELC